MQKSFHQVQARKPAFGREYFEDSAPRHSFPVFFCRFSSVGLHFFDFCSWLVKDFAAAVRTCKSFLERSSRYLLLALETFVVCHFNDYFYFLFEVIRIGCEFFLAFFALPYPC